MAAEEDRISCGFGSFFSRNVNHILGNAQQSRLNQCCNSPHLLNTETNAQFCNLLSIFILTFNFTKYIMVNNSPHLNPNLQIMYDLKWDC